MTDKLSYQELVLKQYAQLALLLPHTTEDYRVAMGHEGPLAYTWKDKPHRLIYDLCNEVDRLQKCIAELQPDEFREFMRGKACTDSLPLPLEIEELEETIEKLDREIEYLEDQICMMEPVEDNE